MSAKKKNTTDKEKDLPVLEINPSEEFHPRPIWQRIIAWILIVMIVAATGIFALWGKVII